MARNKNAYREWFEESKGVWLFRINGMIVSVHRHMHFPPDVWLVSCADVGVERVPLDNRETEAAQREALRFIHDRLEGMAYNFPYPTEGQP